MTENEIATKIIECAIDVHRALGPGLLERVYEECLAYELRNSGLLVEKQVKMPIVYKEVELDEGYRMDLLVNEKVVVELKCVEYIHDVHEAQLLTYLKLGNYKLGLLLNFHTKLLKDGIKRMVNNL